MEFQIKRGYKRYLIDDDNNPLIPLEEGCWYLTLDTVEIFVAINGQLKPLNQAEINIDDYDQRFEAIESRLEELENRAQPESEITFAERAQFPTEGVINKLYIALDEKASYIWDGDSYVKISGEAEDITIKLIDGGSAVEEL